MSNFAKEEALILFSGGQDSTTCLFWAKQNFAKVHAVCFSYGQRHSAEIENARAIAQKASVPFEVIDASVISKLAPNSLTDTRIEMDKVKETDAFPNTFVPGRNMLFLTIAATIAYAKGIRHLVTGVSEADYSGYPDCRSSFVLSLNAAINLAMDRQFVVHTPLMWLNKEQIWQMADKLGVFDVVREQTLTCYNGIKAEGCGQCPACRLRQEGLSRYIARKQKEQN